MRNNVSLEAVYIYIYILGNLKEIKNIGTHRTFMRDFCI